MFKKIIGINTVALGRMKDYKFKIAERSGEVIS
jgi:hypothetical protein